MIVIAHVSDLHLDNSRRSTDRAERIVVYLTALAHQVDALVITGDIADHGLPVEYAQASNILTAAGTVLTCPGNHDSRPAYRTELLGEPEDETPINKSHIVSGVHFVLCDSTIPNRDDGLLTDETIAWLDATLTEYPELPAFVCFHHPPVKLHSSYIDKLRQDDEQRLVDVVERHPQVAALLCGHAHTPAATTFAGRPLLVAPGVASTLRLPWERGGDILDYRLPPAVAFHVLDDEGRLTTHYRFVS